MRAAKIDGNQRAIVDGLRKFGCTVQSLATIGKGCPDILVGYRCENFLFEIKDPQRGPKACQLRPDQQEWHDAWRGSVFKIETLSEALDILRDVA